MSHRMFVGGFRSAIIGPTTQDEQVAAEGLYFRIALVVAMTSSVFEHAMGKVTSLDEMTLGEFLLLGLQVLSLPLSATYRYARLGVVLFGLAILIHAFGGWYYIANHSWLAVWTIPVAAMFARWWDSEAYSDYLRITLGVVMLAAATQKLVAGTYLDGTYIAFLSHFGSPTERMFAPLCSADTLSAPCAWHVYIGRFIVAWQLLVGLLLIAGLRSIWFLTIEIGFLLGAGLFADEMNFQVLNIGLLCIAFRVGMSFWLAATCAALLIIDVLEISRIVEYVV